MSSNTTKNDNEPEQDPYMVLGVPHTASDADINKAFKKLALKLHPDKQQQQQQKQEGKNSNNNINNSITREQAVEEAFHQVQWAKSFLLDVEFAEQRRRYDAQRASIQARRFADEARSAGMSDKRRRMRDELQRQEQQASHLLKKRNESASSAVAATYGSSRSQAEDGSKKAAKRDRKKSSKQSSTTSAEEAAKLERLRRQGNEMREAYADRQEQTAAAAAATAKSRSSRREREQYDYVQQEDDDDEQQQRRQVRLKWSRKKMANISSRGSVLTESSLMQILKQRGFGDIERVEMLGNKGNAALVTFVSADSCRPCVDALIDSEEMRATFVGKRKEQEELKDEAAAAAADKRKKEQERLSSSALNRDAESVADWKLRRAAEREELLRQVERDEDTITATKTEANNNTSSSSRGQKRKSTDAVFPPLLPKNNNNNTPGYLSPFERLQRAEVEILEKNGILSKQEMRAFLSAF